MFTLMLYPVAYDGSLTAGNREDQLPGFGDEAPSNLAAPKGLGGKKLFMRKNPGSPGKLGKSSTKAESLSKLRGKGALA